MSTRKRHRAKQNIFRQIWKLTSAIPKWLISWFLRTLLVIGRKPRFAKSGFVLPTTALLLIILALVVGSLIFRSFSRTNQVLAAREQKVIYNAATPAIDRAKAKLEYLFKQDDRLPGGVPSSAVLSSMMLNDGLNGVAANSTKHPYTFPDEKRLDIDHDGKLDNIWAFPVDSSGSKIGDTTTVYSILSATESGTGTSAVTIDKSTDAQKAATLVVRNAPLSSFQNSLSGCKTDSRTPENGWYQLNSATLRKNFQVDAFVINNKTSAKTVTTLELQQDRQVDKGNKWGVWFRNDLEIFPYPTFNFNGAMHTEGNLIVGGDDNKVIGYMISSHNSCLYNQDASKITVAKQANFQGEIISGNVRDDQFKNESYFHLFNGLGNAPTRNENINKLNKDTDSITPNDDNLVSKIALDPVALFTRNESKHRDSSGWSRDGDWENRELVKRRRIFNDISPQPYVDDTYRADNRYGPKPKYSELLEIPSGKKVGDEITSVTELTENAPPSGSDKFGFDGYWERRARANGLRLIVGERLDLGNTYGWEGTNDPLYPPSSTAITHETRQRRTLRDNLAAVQATAVYHYENGNSGYFPVACLATTAHPGTNQTIDNSTNFTLRNFFIGRGTNGWEYAPPTTNETTFADNIASSKPLGKALRNLAYFAGDPDGAFPPKQETSGSIVHPYSYLAMWGDFSNLRRVIKKLDVDSIKYADLSIADKTYLQTASCSMGMLAHNIKDAEDITTKLIADGKNVVSLGEHIWQGFVGKGSGTIDLSQSFCDASTKKCKLPNPELLLAGLKDDEKQQLMSFNTSRQIARDRKYGFLSPATSSSTFSFKDGSKDYIFDFSPECNPTDTSYIFKAAFSGGGGGLDPKKAGMSMVCEVVTKYPSLYYLFPTVDHDHDGNNDTATGGVDHRQPTSEKYIDDAYIKGTSVNGSYTYKALNNTDIANMAIAPKTTTWVLPKTTTAPTAPNVGNQVTDPDGNTVYVPFLDTALSNGREMMSVRVLNVDLDLLRSNKVVNDTWLPVKDGIVYAFREDAVREDSIARPASKDWSTYKDDPTNADYRMKANTPQDPPVNADNGISSKPVDYYPDPDRRPYGFRLRNGRNLKRNATGISASDNINGLTFVSDNPVYVQGDFNLHSTDGTISNLLEEFTEKLGSDWTTNPNFYTGRSTVDSKFADATQDTWRATEILADAITILSNNFIDGSIEDAFTKAIEPGLNTTNTSYQNQNRPNYNSTKLTNLNYWIREEPYKPTTVSTLGESPVKLNRDGYPLYCKVNTIPCPTSNVEAYDGTPTTETFRAFSRTERKKELVKAAETRVNSILISGLVPSQAKQSYGGLHNFPRFLEYWRTEIDAGTFIPLHISGSFLQLNFSTSATGPFDQDAWEPNSTPSSDEHMRYYEPPARRWGYDVGLQYAPAGAAARRFVTLNNTRSEFYRELPVDDPYIKNLRCTKLGTQQIDSSASCS
ncbi:hormogonium polysaccharide biosynthesis protein HpsA [Chroococcidiopsis thermalis]|uniref:Uncharacterized protein n=1 Tax=Chroococcidiopsis thermalis (strain PCC 7203) TaxID=251229 RepID=K9TVT6_CHRTP|nr:hormogonium polysaccharide biosynthesis protein HpsA [Chroococcidiopsis thermalis]AFY86680.1 hypothetical protein Chro_1151 [Chroococcidiopsis thermalis PCC 7203]